jgi:hypothetical protein
MINTWMHKVVVDGTVYMVGQWVVLNTAQCELNNKTVSIVN